jgi:hypothetical protein
MLLGMKLPNLSSPPIIALALFAATMSLGLLYFFNPADNAFFPRCPFFTITGYKCPGCGTLRGLHALLHFHLTTALRLNALMVLSIPLLIALITSRKLMFHVFTARAILITVLFWWLFRNLIGI